MDLWSSFVWSISAGVITLSQKEYRRAGKDSEQVNRLGESSKKGKAKAFKSLKVFSFETNPMAKEKHDRYIKLCMVGKTTHGVEKNGTIP